MTNFTELTPVPSDRPVSVADPLRLALAAYLARFKGSSASTPNQICAATSAGARNGAWTRWLRGAPHLELYIRWMQEIRRFKPSTVSRRFSVAAGFYRTCVITAS
jgi:integrase/recombinase XerD